MNQESNTAAANRRVQSRQEPSRYICVRRVMPVMPISDAVVLNVSSTGLALRTSMPIDVGERLSFSLGQGTPPILGEVLDCEELEDGNFKVRCQCLLGSLDTTLD